ncbi:MAG TPA: response regulator [Anaerolineales bacterium]|nr:response regulator [Anaerolineales bacterium]
MAVATRTRQPALRAPTQANGKLRVLIVDDEIAFGNVMREVLLSFGMDVRVAVGASPALEMMRSEPPDLLMVDVMMPEVDGLSLIRMVQKEPDWLKIPILVVSARTGQADQHEALFAGADGFLAKPFTADELRRALRPFLPTGTEL